MLGLIEGNCMNFPMIANIAIVSLRTWRGEGKAQMSSYEWNTAHKRDKAADEATTPTPMEVNVNETFAGDLDGE